MSQLTIIDYRAGGSSELILKASLEPHSSAGTISAVRDVLLARSHVTAARLIQDTRPALYQGTNGFGDDFLVIKIMAGPSKMAQLLGESKAVGSTLRADAAAIREAANVVVGGTPEVRFVVLDPAAEVVLGLKGQYVVGDRIDSGGFAEICSAYASNGQCFALKRNHHIDEESIARLRREIEEQLKLRHPSIMPVVDHDQEFRWFLMPMAAENLAAHWRAGPISNQHLIAIISSIASGLSAAHSLRLTHRDISPRNVLKLGSTWVVADWGLIRRPPGNTSVIRTHGSVGTQGFSAPEAYREPHTVGPPADVYSLGRIAAWSVTRQWPEQNVQLVPDGPWRQFVQRTTEHSVASRAQTMVEVLSLLAQVESLLEEQAAFDSLPIESDYETWFRLIGVLIGPKTPVHAAAEAAHRLSRHMPAANADQQAAVTAVMGKLTDIQLLKLIAVADHMLDSDGSFAQDVVDLLAYDAKSGARLEALLRAGSVPPLLRGTTVQVVEALTGRERADLRGAP